MLLERGSRSVAGEREQLDSRGEPDRSVMPINRSLRFTLRTLLAAMAFVAVALTVWQAVGPTVGLMLLVGFLAVSLHVLGNALGTRLREQGTMGNGDAGGQDSLPEGACPRRAAGPSLAAHQFAPATRLSRHGSLGWPPLIVASAAGLLGAIGGGRASQELYPEATTWPALAVAALAGGALAAMFAYWFSSWLHVFLAAWWQAHREAHQR